MPSPWLHWTPILAHQSWDGLGQDLKSAFFCDQPSASLSSIYLHVNLPFSITVL